MELKGYCFRSQYNSCDVVSIVFSAGPLILSNIFGILKGTISFSVLIDSSEHRRTGRVSFGGGGGGGGGLKSLARIFCSIACTKIKWFCPNIA